MLEGSLRYIADQSFTGLGAVLHMGDTVNEGTLVPLMDALDLWVECATVVQSEVI